MKVSVRVLENHHDFLKLLRKLSCESLCLLYLTFIKLLERFIKVLAAILSLEVLQVSLSSSYKSIYRFKDANPALFETA